LPRINIYHLNIILFVIIAWHIVQYHDTLRWAMKEIPRYCQNRISSPIERKLYRQAKSILKESDIVDPAKALLDRSLAIDPNTEALFLLGEYYNKKGDIANALSHYNRYLEIDPTVVKTYLRIADILEKQNKSREAEKILEQGVNYFNKYAAQFKPHLNSQVSQRYNEAAQDVYNDYNDAHDTLKSLLTAYPSQKK